MSLSFISFNVQYRDRRCGTYISKEKLAAAEKHFRDHKVPPSTSFLPEEADPINVYFHVIYANETIDGGFVP